MAPNTPPLDEEAAGLLRRILERQAYRQRMAANIRGHGLKFVAELSEKLTLSTELEHCLRLLSEVERVHSDLGGEQLEDVVRPRMERIPYPESRQELAICLALTGRAERTVARSYVDSASREFAAIARTLAEGTAQPEAEERFAAFAGDKSNRPQAQRYWDRWMTVSLLALGRPGTRGDHRAVELGLRSKHTADVVREFLDETEPLREQCGLRLPQVEGFGVQLPEDLRSRFGQSGF